MGEAVSLTRAGLRPHLALIAVQLMFGTWPIVGKIALRALPSTGLVALRVAGAALAFTALASLAPRAPVRQSGDYARFAFYSLLGIILNQLLFTRGLSLSTATNATLLGTAIPVFTLVISTLLGHERMTWRAAMGTLLAACGVIYLIDPWRADFFGDKTIGNLLLVTNTFCYGAFLAITQDITRRYGALATMARVFAFGCVVAVPVGGFNLAQTPLENVGAGVWLAVLYIILVPTVLAYYLNAWALARVAPSTVAVYIYLQPLFAFAVAPLVLGADERWGARTGVAALLIFAGVAVATWRARSVLKEVSEHPEALGH